MGRPQNSTTLQNFQVWANVGGTEDYAVIQRQKGHSNYIVDQNGTTAEVKLVNTTSLSPGEAYLKVWPGSGTTGGSSGAISARLGIEDDSAVTINSAGSGYAVGDTITLTGGTADTFAVLEVTGETGGAIDSVTVDTKGQYSSLPANPVSQSSTSGSGTGADFNISSWNFTNVVIDTAGSGYQDDPVVTVSGGGGEDAYVEVDTSSGNISAATVVETGTGYTSVPTLALDEAREEAEFAVTIQEHLVKTYQGNSYKWVTGSSPSATESRPFVHEAQLDPSP